MKNKKFVLFCMVFIFSNLCSAQEAEDAQTQILEKELSFLEVTELALQNNLDIQIAKLDAYISRFDLGKAESIFDTYLNLEANYNDDQRKQASTIFGTKTVETNYGVSLEKKMPTGTTVKIEATQERDWTNSAFATLNPAIDAQAKVTLSQSLGKNFFGLSDRLGIKITKLDIESSDWLSLNNIEKALAGAQKAYWTLVLKDEEVRIKKDILKEAQELLKVYKDKYEIGLAELPDLLANEANVKLKENAVLVALLERETAKNELLFLLNLEDTSVNIKPQDILDIAVSRVEIYSSLKEAVDNRRDYRIARNSLLSKDIDVTVKKNALWPEIDLEASLARNGVTTSDKQSWQDVTQEDNPEIFLGITIKMPLENREASSQFNQAKLNKEKSILNLKRVERLIFKELNNQVTQVNTLAEEVKTLRAVAEFQAKKLAAEKKRLQYGRSSSDLIIRYQDDLLQAELSLASALFRYRASLIDLDVAKNTLLDRYWKGTL